jgi:hypothetical protein
LKPTLTTTGLSGVGAKILPRGRCFRGLEQALRIAGTSGARDSFNVGYLAAPVGGGAEPLQAAVPGHKLASAVVAHHGDVIPGEDMPALQAECAVRSVVCCHLLDCFGLPEGYWLAPVTKG